MLIPKINIINNYFINIFSMVSKCQKKFFINLKKFLILLMNYNYYILRFLYMLFFLYIYKNFP